MSSLRTTVIDRQRITFAVACCILVASGIAVQVALNSVIEATDQRMKARVVLVKMETLLSVVQDSEIGLRGFLATGDPEFLQPYYSATARVETEIAQLQQAEQAAFDSNVPGELKRTIAAKLNFLAESIRVSNTRGIEAARDLLRTRDGERSTDAIRRIIAEQSDWVHGVITQRAEVARHAAEMTATVSGFSSLFGLILLGSGFSVLRRETQTLRSTTDQLAGAKASLDDQLRQQITVLSGHHLAFENEQSERVDISKGLSLLHDRLLLLESLPLPLLVVNDNGEITQFNPPAEQLLGHRQEEILNQPIEVLVPQRLREQHRTFRDAFLREPQPRAMGKRLDIWVLHKDGRELPVEIMLNPVNTGLGTSVIVGIVDIREQKAVQDTLAAALKEKTVLLYEVHHRVKNNLAIISSLLNLQSHQSQEPFVRQALDQSQQRIKTISLIHQLLYESQDVATLPFDVYLQRLVGVLANLNRDPSARICCQVEAEPLALTLSQAIPCALLVNELVTNAYKHAFPAGGSGQIAVRLQALPEHHALLVVEDNGVGMPEERWLKEGTSLGMQLIGVLAEQAHCQIARVPGPGTRIELRLHLEQGNPS